MLRRTAACSSGRGADRDLEWGAAGWPVDDHADRVRHLGAHRLEIEPLGETGDDEGELHLGEREPDIYGSTTLAEGVETAEQLQALIDIGCDAASGYYLGRPTPADDFIATHYVATTHDVNHSTQSPG